MADVVRSSICPQAVARSRPGGIRSFHSTPLWSPSCSYQRHHLQAVSSDLSPCSCYHCWAHMEGYPQTSPPPGLCLWTGDFLTGSVLHA